MGPVAHRRLINWLSMAIALQLAVAMVALAVRAGRDIDAKGPGYALGQAQNGSVLGGARIAKRGEGRPRSRPAPSSTTTTLAPTTTAPAVVTPVTEATAPPTTSAPVTAPPTTAKPQPRASAHTPADKRTTTTTLAPKPPAGAAPGDPGLIEDPAGDTVADGTGQPASDPRGDITRAGASYGPKGLTFAIQVQRPSDPRKDQRWAADSTYAQWEVDTNNDAAPDYEVQYYFVDEDTLAGSVSKPGGGGEQVCDVFDATYGATTGYELTVDPACLGNPASFSYRASLFYDTNPEDENAVVVTDTTPNGGWSFPVAKP